MKESKELSLTEMEIMNVLWENKAPMSFCELLDYFNTKGGRNWKRQTLSTFVLRLGKKDLIVSEKTGRTVSYSPQISKDEYECRRAVNVIDVLYHGSISKFMAALAHGNHLTSNQIDELKDWVERR